MNAEELINAYLDESLTEDELRELSEWIKADPANARQFSKAVMLHDRLQCEINAQAETQTSVEEPVNVVPFPASSLGKRLIQLAAAIVLMLTILYWPTGPQKRVVQHQVEPQPIAEAFATIAQLADAGAGLTLGQRVGKQTIVMDAGLLRLQFDSGVEVTLQGPAKYEVLAPTLTRLSSGLLTANVPPGAEGFRVDTPTAEVTDLGTSFGVRLDPDGASHVSVFDGEVEVEEPASGEKKLLKEGEAVRVTVDKLEAAEFDTRHFERVWPISTGIIVASDSFKLAPPWPRRVGFFASDDHVYLYPDGYRRRLRVPLMVNISRPGTVVTQDQLTPREIRAGRPVRSFIIQYQPETDMSRAEVTRLEGSITFDRPILGLIVTAEELTNSSGRFSKRKLRGPPRRQLEFNGLPAGDRLTLSEDRRTLTIDLASPNRSTDVMRVIVDATPPHRLLMP